MSPSPFEAQLEDALMCLSLAPVRAQADLYRASLARRGARAVPLLRGLRVDLSLQLSYDRVKKLLFIPISHATWSAGEAALTVEMSPAEGPAVEAAPSRGSLRVELPPDLRLPTREADDFALEMAGWPPLRVAIGAKGAVRGTWDPVGKPTRLSDWPTDLTARLLASLSSWLEGRAAGESTPWPAPAADATPHAPDTLLGLLRSLNETFARIEGRLALGDDASEAYRTLAAMVRTLHPDLGLSFFLGRVSGKVLVSFDPAGELATKASANLAPVAFELERMDGTLRASARGRREVDPDFVASLLELVLPNADLVLADYQRLLPAWYHPRLSLESLRAFLASGDGVRTRHALDVSGGPEPTLWVLLFEPTPPDARRLLLKVRPRLGADGRPDGLEEQRPIEVLAARFPPDLDIPLSILGPPRMDADLERELSASLRAMKEWSRFLRAPS